MGHLGWLYSLTSILDISTALMRPRRPKQYCLQLYIYIYIFIYIYLTGFVKRCLKKLSNQANSAAVTKLNKKVPSPPLCFGQTTANHHPTPHCGLTLIGDQKQTIIQAYTSPGKIAKASYTVKSHLTRPQTLTPVKVSKQQPRQPCAFDRQLRVRTVPGLFGKAGLDGKPPQF